MLPRFRVKYKGKMHNFLESGEDGHFSSYVYKGNRYIGKTNEYVVSIAEMGDNVRACDFITSIDKNACEPAHNLLSDIFS